MVIASATRTDVDDDAVADTDRPVPATTARRLVRHVYCTLDRPEHDLTGAPCWCGAVAQPVFAEGTTTVVGTVVVHERVQ